MIDSKEDCKFDLGVKGLRTINLQCWNRLTWGYAVFTIKCTRTIQKK